MIFDNVRLVDALGDRFGSLIVEDGLILTVLPEGERTPAKDSMVGAGNTDSAGDSDCADETDRAGSVQVDPLPRRARIIIDGRRGERRLTLMPAFVDLHAHFRDPGFPEKETLESGCIAAAAGGFGTVVCMANTNPVMDDPQRALALRARAAALGLIDLYPALSLTKGMEGKDSSHLEELAKASPIGSPGIAAHPASPSGAAEGLRLLSEDGKDVEDDRVLSEAFRKARELDLLVSCHCDREGEDQASKRVLELGARLGTRVHLAHVSTAVSIVLMREAKRSASAKPGGASSAIAAPAVASPTCEVTPHHLALTEADAARLGAGSWGKVAPPLRSEADRRALLEGIRDGTVDAIATDHAPHTKENKLAGSPGFVGLETAFGVAYSELVRSEIINLSRLSALMSANPARILGLKDRGLLVPGARADLVLVDEEESWTVDADRMRSRGSNTPFAGRTLWGKIMMTIHGGTISYDGEKQHV